MPEWGGIKTCKKEKPLKVINLWGDYILILMRMLNFAT